MQRSLPILLCSVVGFLMLIQYFMPHQISQDFFGLTGDWFRIIEVFGLTVGVMSVLMVHARRIKARSENWQYSYFVYVGLALLPIATIIDSVSSVGFSEFVKGQIITDGVWFDWVFFSVQVPLGATVFSMLAFYITSATYRAFRARTFDATLLLGAGVIVLIANAPPSDAIWNSIFPFWENAPSVMKDWILEVPNGSAQRALLLGLGLGAVSQSLRVMLGIDRGWIGG